MSAAGLIVEGLFALLHPSLRIRTCAVVRTGFRWNDTSVLDIAAIGVFASLCWLNRNRERFGGSGYATEPICKMQVRTADAATSALHDGLRVYVCSDRCRERLEADLGADIGRNARKSPPAEEAATP